MMAQETRTFSIQVPVSSAANEDDIIRHQAVAALDQLKRAFALSHSRAPHD
jgi:hypothetical protein